jgi:hypothetical protein
LKVHCKYILEKGKVIAKSEQEEWPKKWNTEILYWDLVQDSEDIPGVKLEKASIARALLRWQIVIKDLKFRRYNSRSIRQRKRGNKATIRIEFKQEDEVWAKSPGVLAYAYFPGQGKVSGKVVFNEKALWSLDGKSIKAWKIDKRYTKESKTKLKTYLIEHVLLHEFGHMLGLKHDTQDKSSVMYPYYSGILKLSKSDVSRIQAKYGVRPNWDKWLVRLKGYFGRSLVE